MPRKGHWRRRPLCVNSGGMKRLLPLLILALSGCAADRPAPLVRSGDPAGPTVAPSGTAATAPSAGRIAAPPAAASAARFDGTYKGVRTVVLAGGPDCARSGAPRNLVVQDGTARMIWNPGLGSSFAGNVAADGTLSMALDDQRAPTALAGSINGAQATGRTSGEGCQYEMSWRRSR
jgi:hypothetical protein